MPAPLSEEALAQLLQSLARAKTNTAFMDVFYEDFFGQSTGALQFFASVDLQRQKRKLDSSLEIVLKAIRGEPGTELYLGYLGRVHQRFRIPPELFDIWIDSLILALQRCDRDWTPALEATWRSALKACLQSMTDDGHY